MQPILTQLDKDEQEFVEKLPKNEQKAMQLVLERFNKQHRKQKSKKETAAVNERLNSGEARLAIEIAARTPSSSIADKYEAQVEKILSRNFDFELNTDYDEDRGIMEFEFGVASAQLRKAFAKAVVDAAKNTPRVATASIVEQKTKGQGYRAVVEITLDSDTSSVQIAASGDEWWKSLTKKQQQEYIKLHPRSKYAKNVKSSDTKSEKTKADPNSKEAKELKSSIAFNIIELKRAYSKSGKESLKKEISEDRKALEKLTGEKNWTPTKVSLKRATEGYD